MDMEGMEFLLWEYYKKAAELRGRRLLRDAEGEERYVQSNYSLFWFFQQEVQDLNSIARAFLGDRKAMEELDWAAAPSEGWEPFVLEGRELNDSQKEAVRSALAAPVSFIKGPPGTGKTETILNLACCAARQEAGRSVAIVSSNNSALDNICKKIMEYEGTEPNRHWLQKHFARLGNQTARKQFVDNRPGENHFVFESAKVKISSDCGVLSVSREKNILAQDFLQEYPIITSTIHSLKNCFQDGGTYTFDYVIMDEASQTDAMAGIVAMSSARHLVLVGDPKQLPPVVPATHVQAMAAVAADNGWEIPAEYETTEERSFLDVCLDVFGDRTARTTLRIHYRCHPGIFRFCTEEIYQEEQLKIETPEYDQSVQTPIKVLWFEGNYCEKCRLQGRDRNSKHNIKQVLCFMEEEWPWLQKRLLGPEPPKVCILSPFHGQLAALKEAIEAADENVQVSLEGSERADGSSQTPIMLTIHKAQGREYDIVYLLPVEDGDWEWPWSQQKRLINVAVSRAMKELRLILSSVLMEQELQRELTGRPVPPNPGRRGLEQDMSPEEKRREEQRRAEKAKDQRYLQKLVRYVRDENKELERKSGTAGYPASTYDYGFHRSARTSIFDLESWYRTCRGPGREAQDTQGNRITGRSSPEICVETVLVELMQRLREETGEELSLYTDVLLQDLRDAKGQPLVLPEDDADMRRLVKYGGHLDFVLCKDSRVLLAVEVDGRYHREPGPEGEIRRRRDQAKNRQMKDVLGADLYFGNCRKDQDIPAEGTLAFLRLPDDGTTCLETRALWQQADEDLQTRYFHLEELIEARLAHLDKAEITLPTLGIQALLHQEKERTGASEDLAWVNRILAEEHGLIHREAYRPLDAASCAPTERGRYWGILTAFRFGGGGLRRDAAYPPSAQRRVLHLLSGGGAGSESLPLSACMSVDRLLVGIFDWFYGYLMALETPEERTRVLAELQTKVSFDSDRPDYSTQTSQALYLLRYLYGYAFEYKRMYSQLLLNQYPEGERFSVTSIGCGNMVDYWGLRAALDACEEGGTADYTGVDINAWAESFQIRAAGEDTVLFVRQDAARYLQEQARDSAGASDVYVFPKSISDFDGRDETDGPVFTGIREGLRDVLKETGKDRVHLLFSLRRSRDCGIYEADERKCQLLRESVEEAGYQLEGTPEGHQLVEEASDAISWLDPEFTYPQFILDSLYKYGMTRSPVMKAEYMCCRMLSFQRKR